MLVDAPRITLEIQADPNVHDSFIACLCAILESWGQPADYAYVAGLSGIAFSPVLDTGENCRAWWTEGGDDIRLDFLGRALGFAVEKTTTESGSGDTVWDTHPEPDELPESHRRYLYRLKRALADGDGVIVRTWPTWSVLTGWSSDVTRLSFETVSGFKELCARVQPPHKTELAYVFTHTDPVLLKEDAIYEALTFGAQVAAGSFKDERFKYGGTLYDAIADRLDHDPFCDPCGEKSHTCAYRTFHRVVGTAQSAIDFLEQTCVVIDTHPDARTRAIDRYRSLIATTAPYIDGQSLSAGWSDPVFHAELKENVLRMRSLHDDATKALGELIH